MLGHLSDAVSNGIGGAQTRSEAFGIPIRGLTLRLLDSSLLCGSQVPILLTARRLVLKFVGET